MQPRRTDSGRSRPKVIAIISTFNEEDVIEQVVRDYVEQGVSVYVLDDGSTDGTVKAIEPHVGKGLIAIERLPPIVGPNSQPALSWTRILRRKEELSRELDGDWYIHADADELRESPWQERTLVEAIDLVDQLGFNAINFAVFNFCPVHDGYCPGDNLREQFLYYAPVQSFDRIQIKAWKRPAVPVDLVTEGGHEARFPGRRVFPLSFLLRHYPIRGQAQGERKIFQERRARFLPEERQRKWHLQYDEFKRGATLIRDPSTLIRFDPGLARAQLYLHAIEEAEHAADVLGLQLANALEACERINAEHTAFAASRKDVDREAERLSREYGAMTVSRDELRRVVERLGAELAVSGERRGLEQASLMASRDELAREHQRISHEYGTMTVSRDELALALERLHQQHTEVVVSRHELAQQVDRAFRELAASSERWSREHSAGIVDRERLAHEVERLRHEHASVVASRDELAHENERLGREYTAMTANRDEQAREAERLSREYGAMTASRDDLALVAAQLAREHDALAIRRGDFDQLQARADRLQTELEARTTELDGVRAELDGVRAELDGVRAELDGVRAELNGVRAELASRTLSRRLRSVRTQLGSVLGPVVSRLRERTLAPPPLPTDAPELHTVEEADDAYATWVRETSPTDEEADRMRDAITRWAYQPVISVLVTVPRGDEASLVGGRAMLGGQVYRRWELCPVDSSRSAESGGLVAAFNDALAFATGEFVTWVEGEDKLDPQALAEVVLALQEGEIDVVYTDEDKLSTSGRRHTPFFKPDWSPELLESMNYLGHLTVIRRTVLDGVGGFRGGFSGAEDYDLVLRATEKARRVHHVPRVLYHQRTVARISSEGGRHALGAALQRRSERGAIESTPNRAGWYRTRRDVQGEPRVTIIIPTRDQAEMLERCLDSLATTSYKAFDILIIDNGSVTSPTRRLLGRLRHRGVRVVRDEQPFNFSQLNNSAAQLTSTPFLLFLNDDTRVVAPDWLTAMLEHAQRREVGAVGARLVHEDGSLQHGGVALGCGGGADVLAGIAAHTWRGQRLEALDLAHATRNLSAVTAACLLVRRSAFDEVGGFDVALPVTYNDVDLCLKIRERGYRIVYTPWATLIHHESATRGVGGGGDEPRLMIERWGPELLSDPYYSPNLSLEDSRARLRFRAERDRVAAELVRRSDAQRGSSPRSVPRLLT